jgi:glycerol-3-phosphate acyltransferase PlsY
MRARHWPVRRSLLAVAFGFAVGCFPTARLAAKLADPVARRRLAGENPGASSINRVMGKKAAAAVLAVDVLKGSLPVVLGRDAGAGRLTVEALALAPMAGHVAVLKGRGGAALAGGVAAVDPAAFLLLAPIWVGATIKRDNARGALVACLFYPVLRLLLGRSRAGVAVSSLAPVLLIYARLRGVGWKHAPLTSALLWQRLTRDAELPAPGARVAGARG